MHLLVFKGKELQAPIRKGKEDHHFFEENIWYLLNDMKKNNDS